MNVVYSALAAAFEVAWKSGIIVVAIALIASMTSGEKGKASPESTEVDPAKEVATAPGGETNRVSMALPEGAFFSTCSLTDGEGNELIRATYDRTGGLWVHWGDAFPVQPAVTVTRRSAVEFTLRDRRALYHLRVRPQDASGLTISGPAPYGRHGLGINESGEAVNDPDLIDQE